MLESDVIMMNDLLNELTKYRELFLTRSISLNEKISDEYYGKSSLYKNSIKNILNELSEKFLDLNNDLIQRSQNTSYSLNLFKMFGVSETMHSYILANLLNPYSEHGQKHLFLNNFLDLIGIKRFGDQEHWIVTAEKGRIDVLLKRVKPHAVIIIENKSNYAQDQEYQIYRYWYQEIYNPMRRENRQSFDFMNPPQDQYQILFLSPSPEKVPGNQSLQRPPYLDDPQLPDEVPMKPKQIVFNDFVVRWLRLSLEKLPADNHRIKEHIKQYTELWT